VFRQAFFSISASGIFGFSTEIFLISA